MSPCFKLTSLWLGLAVNLAMAVCAEHYALGEFRHCLLPAMWDAVFRKTKVLQLRVAMMKLEERREAVTPTQVARRSHVGDSLDFPAAPMSDDRI